MALNALPPSTGSPSMEQKIFLPGSTFRQTFWDPRVQSARVVGWATGISATDTSPRRSVVDKYFATFGFFYPEAITDNNMVLDNIVVEIRSPTKAHFVANYKIQTFNISAGPGFSHSLHLRPSRIGFNTYRSYIDPDATTPTRIIDVDGMPAGPLNSLKTVSECVGASTPKLVVLDRATTEMTVTASLGQNPLSELASLRGNLNDANVTIIGITFAKGQVMYMNETMEVFEHRFGTVFVVTYHFDLDVLGHLEQGLFVADQDLDTVCQPPEGPGLQWKTASVPMGNYINFLGAFPT